MHTQTILKNLRALAAEFGQSHLVEGVASWTQKEMLALLTTLESFPRDLLVRQREALQRGHLPTGECQPYSDYAFHSSVAIGEENAAKVACIILAGGQGTRLGKGPKALFPLFPEKGKTLLDIQVENLRQASQEAPLAIMCSPQNIELIRKASEKFHGIEYFAQDLLPLLDSEDNWFIESEGVLSRGPDGNGRVFHALERAGILEKWHERGIEHIAVFPIDNPLARPLDPALIAFHRSCGCHVTTACVLREDPQEHVGAFAMRGGRPCVLEYSEIDPDARAARHPDGSLIYALANINIFIFRMQFAKKLAEAAFPWHIAKKKAKRFEEEISVTKFETFLFDALPLTTRMPALVYPREEIYAPLKNASGERSPETVRNAMLARKNSSFC